MAAILWRCVPFLDVEPVDLDTVACNTCAVLQFGSCFHGLRNLILQAAPYCRVAWHKASVVTVGTSDVDGFLQCTEV